jgi:hypothetical protein
MILNLTTFTLTGGIYYSNPFSIFSSDNFLSVIATLAANGTVSIQQSLDEVT